MYVPVICYGLRTDYKTRLFPGSKRLMELADTIEEIKTICVFCNKKSVVNMKHSNGKIIIVNQKEIIEPEEELVKDVMSILNVYVAKMNGLRKYNKVNKSIKK